MPPQTLTYLISDAPTVSPAMTAFTKASSSLNRAESILCDASMWKITSTGVLLHSGGAVIGVVVGADVVDKSTYVDVLKSTICASVALSAYFSNSLFGSYFGPCENACISNSVDTSHTAKLFAIRSTTTATNRYEVTIKHTTI